MTVAVAVAVAVTVRVTVGAASPTLEAEVTGLDFPGGVLQPADPKARRIQTIEKNLRPKSIPRGTPFDSRISVWCGCQRLPQSSHVSAWRGIEGWAGYLATPLGLRNGADTPPRSRECPGRSDQSPPLHSMPSGASVDWLARHKVIIQSITNPSVTTCDDSRITYARKAHSIEVR